MSKILPSEINECLHKHHNCIDCAFSRIKGRTDITKCYGMCKLSTNGLLIKAFTRGECIQILKNLSNKEQEKYKLSKLYK